MRDVNDNSPGTLTNEPIITTVYVPAAYACVTDLCVPPSPQLTLVISDKLIGAKLIVVLAGIFSVTV
jgi:hypothetical protein